MELRQLEHFLVLAEELHFTRAAARVHLVQSSLSSSIAALERELDAELFVRSRRRVTLTEAGRALLPAARRAAAAAEECRDAVAAIRGVLRGRVRIGAIQAVGGIPLSRLLGEFHARHPAVHLHLRHDSVPGLVREVVDGGLDLAFVDRPFDTRHVEYRTLAAQSLVLAVSAGDPLAGRDRVALAELADREFVEYRADSALRNRIDAVCDRIGLARRSSCEVDTIADLLDSVEQGIGVALVPPEAVRRHPEVRTLETDPGIGREVVVVHAADRPPSPAAAAFLALLPA
ncbi:LysR family transcriptional regulator [Amycolatopsis benzoatilytica]|uniref:LysR family transcriptional regulator n=1 Tax=Amycolatopsis benzoatilytica TaxID=346045 RepID=UPI000372B9E9|nr:LysR family transcriptional regulator [Amycolatopsis benzoatilytica]